MSSDREPLSRQRRADRLLLERTAAGSREAWEELRGRYSFALYAHVLPLLRDPRDADQVVAEVFAYAWCSAGRNDWAECESAATWLLGLARRVLFEHRQPDANGVAATVRPTAAATSRTRPISSANDSSVSD
jgi:DNA-directed RNA polymerase specialized sigma24 family protein